MHINEVYILGELSLQQVSVYKPRTQVPVWGFQVSDVKSYIACEHGYIDVLPLVLAISDVCFSNLLPP